MSGAYNFSYEGKGNFRVQAHRSWSNSEVKFKVRGQIFGMECMVNSRDLALPSTAKKDL